LKQYFFYIYQLIFGSFSTLCATDLTGKEQMNLNAP